MLRIERAIRSRGYARVAGVDEAGRGPIAGPVLAAAVVLPSGFSMPGLTDSKQLTAARRVAFYERLRTTAGVHRAVVSVSVGEIDRTDILRATEAAMRRALARLACGVEFALVDGRPIRGLDLPQEGVVGGDALSWSIAAASILAKVTRDRIMDRYARRYPDYGFESNRGYATAQHLAALSVHGPCPIHRLTFEPVRRAAGLGQLEFGGW